MRIKSLRNAVWIAIASASLTLVAVWCVRSRMKRNEDADYYGQYR